ncbi:MAG: carotenoid oxygenase family protein, partial [Myxococcota bacterium]
MVVTPHRLIDLVQASMKTLASPVLEEVELELVEGTIPLEIEGVLLRNGAGRQHRGGIAYGHPFDGDGFLQ